MIFFGSFCTFLLEAKHIYIFTYLAQVWFHTFPEDVTALHRTLMFDKEIQCSEYLFQVFIHFQMYKYRNQAFTATVYR